MLAERVWPPVNRTRFDTARCSRERIHKFCNSWPASTFSSSVDPLADRATALSSPIDQKHLPYQTDDHSGCFDLVATSDQQLRTDNYRLSSSVRFMPLSSHGHAWSWNAGGRAQILTVICCDELHGRGIAKTFAETCARDPIVGLRKYAALASVWQLDSFWFFCRQTP
jgi:hypothetical protein